MESAFAPAKSAIERSPDQVPAVVMPLFGVAEMIDGIANELVAAGVPHDCIVLAFKSPEMRKHTDFAVS